uniref:Uncharacterized protein n=1 Tax=Serratia phage Kevin TaxID=3161161 RepID=A0AAU8KX37_9CAUD
MSWLTSANAAGEGKPSPLPNYDCMDMGADAISIIRIKSGKYRGFQYRYGKVSFTDNESGGIELIFTVEVIKKPFWRRVPKENDVYFTRVTGDILMDLMNKNAGSVHTILVA